MRRVATFKLLFQPNLYTLPVAIRLTRSRQARAVEPQAHAAPWSRTFPEVTAGDNRIQKRSSPGGCGLNESPRILFMNA